MKTLLWLLLASVLARAIPANAAEPAVERIDLFDPMSGAYLGSERTWYGADGRRLRWEIKDAEGAPSLLFLVLHDSTGREDRAIYFEDGAEEPSREYFSYSEDGRTRTVSYVSDSGANGERTEVDLDESGREIGKRFYRANGSQYGEEEVLWTDRGEQLGWDFRYVEKPGGASFRYEYEETPAEGPWVRRVRFRDQVAERVEVRTLIPRALNAPLVTPVRFAQGVVSTEEFETSPSLSKDGATMVFARYGDEWASKRPFIAYREERGWRVESLSQLGKVYNLALAPDGQSILYSTRSRDERQMFRVRRSQDGWSQPENLTESYGIRGTYPCIAESGDLFFFDAGGESGAGIYRALRSGSGFGSVQAVFTPEGDAPFDGFTSDGSRLWVTRCLDDGCETGPRNGIWEIDLGSAVVSERKLSAVPYAWGVQPVESLGLLVFTDGEDILALPLASAGLSRP